MNLLDHYLNADFWLFLYAYALDNASDNAPTLFSSRIDGALLPGPWWAI